MDRRARHLRVARRDQAQPRPGSRQRAVVLVAFKAKPSVAAEEAASLDRHCARRRVDEAAGTKEGAPQGAEPRKVTEENKEVEEEKMSGGLAASEPTVLDNGGAADGLPTTASRTL